MPELEKPYWMHGKYPHIRIPKALINQKCFSNLSCEAMLLYGAMMDRTSLSIRFGGKRFLNKDNEVTIIYSQKDIMKLLRCKRDKARTVTKELIDSHLITVERKHRRGPYIITVVPYDWAHYPQRISVKRQTSMTENPANEAEKASLLDDGKSDINNTEVNNTDTINMDPIDQKNFFALSSNCAIDHIYLIENYGLDVIQRIQKVLSNIENGDFIPEFNHNSQESTSITQLFSSLQTQHIEYAAKKIKKARYTTDHTQTFILNALWESTFLFRSDE